MVRTQNFLMVTILLASSIQAWASGRELEKQYLDKDGMPICVVSQDEHSFAKFAWNNDLYKRPILARVEVAGADQKKFISTVNSQCHKRVGISVSSPELTTALDLKDGHYEILNDGATDVKGIALNANIRERLDQVILGGEIYRPEDIRTPELYVSKNNVTSYTQELNRELTQKYGIGYSGDVYKVVLSSVPENAKVRSETFENMAKFTKDESYGQSVTDRFQGVTFVIVKGFAHDRNDDDRINPLKKVLQSYKFDILEFVSAPYGRTADNAEVIADQLEEALKAGKRIILTSASAATTQSWGAISILNQRHGGKINEIFPGKVLAYVNLSGVVTGAFGPEAVSGPLAWRLVKGKLTDVVFGSEEQLEQLKAAHATSTGLKKSEIERMITRLENRLAARAQPGAMESFRDLSVRRTQSFLKDVFADMPTDVVYFNFVGVNEKDGLVKDPATNILQNKYIRGKYSKFFTKIGANDGFVEYPGTQLTTAMVPNASIYSLVFNSSHVILDGKFGQYPLLGNFQNQRRLIGSVLMSLGERIKK